MKLWEKYRSLLSGIGVALLALFAFDLILVGPQTEAKEKYRKALDADIEKHIKPGRKGIFEVSQAVEGFKEVNMELSRDLKEKMQAVEIPFHPWVDIPPDYEKGSGPGEWFVLKHAEQCRDLNIECYKANPEVTLKDGDLGFTKILKQNLDPKGAIENLRRLSLVTRVVMLLIDSGVTEIVEITHDEPELAGPEGYPAIMLEYAVKIRVKTRLDPLMRFLHKVRQPGKFFLVVRGLDVEGDDPYGMRGARLLDQDERDLDVTITAAGMRFLTKEQREAIKKADSTAKRKPVKVEYSGPIIH